MRPEWEWWQAKLDGASVQMSEGTPHAGFYRWPSKETYGGPRSFTPVAYWPGENGELNCRVGDRDVSPEYGRDIWVSVGDSPVTEKAYRDVAEHGLPWPDEHPAVPMGHNQPPPDDSFEGLQSAAENLNRQAEQRLQGPPIASQDESDQIANLADQLTKLQNRIKEAKRLEKQPHDEALDQIQKKWAPLVTLTDVYKKLKSQLLTPWTKQPQSTGRMGTRGRAMTLRTTRSAEILDYAACLEFVKDKSEVRAVVQQLADQAARVGIALPGTKIVEEEKVV